MACTPPFTAERLQSHPLVLLADRSLADKTLTKFPHDAAMSNEQMARQIVAKLLAFRTVTPFGTTWEAFAVAEILAALNAVSRPEIRQKRSMARRESYDRRPRG